jgi:soluble lytic murein transglycosylase
MIRIRNSVLALLAFVTVVSVACSLPGQTVVVTATPSPLPVTATSLVPPTATPIPPATVTQTPVPQVAADQAKIALKNGDYDSAIAYFQNLTNQPILSVDPHLRSDAEMGLGIAFTHEAKFSDAVNAFTTFIKDYPDDPRIGQVYYRLASAYVALAQFPSAILDYQTYLIKSPGLIDSYVYERMGDAYTALKQPDKALDAYGKAAAAPRGAEPSAELREKVAGAYLAAGNTKLAIAQYDGIYQVARLPDYKAQIGYTAADLTAKLGDKPGANTRYLDVLTKFPDQPYGYRAMTAYLANGGALDNFTRGKISFAASDWNDAASALLAYTTATPASKVDPSALVMLGHAYAQIGKTDSANVALQAVIDQFPNATAFGDAWLEQGRILYLAKKTPDAIAKYKDLATRHPTLPQSAEALWRAGYLYAVLGDYDNEIATFTILGTNFKGNDWTNQGLFQGANDAYNRNDTTNAQRLFTLLGENGTGSMKAAGYFWLGRLYQIANQNDYARTAYNAAAAADPAGYYGLRASDIIGGTGPFVPPANRDLNFDDPAHIAEAEDWLRTTFKITQTGSLQAISPNLSAAVARGDELEAVGEGAAARDEFESMRLDSQTDPLALYQLAAHLYYSGLNKESIYCAADLIDMAKIPTNLAPKYLAALRFPPDYSDLVLPAAQKNGVDPLLVFSVIRQESVFEGEATSYAAAQGLMQIIPDTGVYIARKLGWTNYQNSDIYKPYINVQFGVYYLKEQLDTFNAFTYAALAAYNAGPGYSSGWYQASNGDPDLFLQAISLDETKAYVRRIYEQYGMYKRIYAAK